MKIYTYDEAFELSKEYFGGDELAAKVFLDKYALRNNEEELLESTPEQMHRRMAKEFARIEASKFADPLTEDEIFGLFDKFKYIVPQGSPMFGIGNEYQTISLSNCYVVESPLDSYGGILKSDQELAQISKRRGGVGIDISNLRPSGTSVKNAARTSTGIESWMERYSYTIREVGQSGRRGALMITISISHPDIENFISIKNDDTKVTGANISIRITDEFMQAVKSGSQYRLRFPIDAPPGKEQIVKWVDAKSIWNKIIHSAWLRAEPGILFWDKITKYNPVDCYADAGFKTISTNPCGELPLSARDSCRLLVLNLYSYIDNPFTKNAKFNFELFSAHSKIAQRLMDDMIDLEIEKLNKIIDKIKNDPEPPDIKRLELELWEGVKTACINGRRTGTGITAEGDAMAALLIPYASKKSIEVASNIHKALMIASYTSSVEMAKELGPFPVWDWNKEKNSEFIKMIGEVDKDLYNSIKKYGRRNIANLTIAPTGSVSLLTQTTSGIEPLFVLEPYTRRKKINPNDENAKTDFVDQNGDHWQEFKVYHPKVKVWMDVTGETDITKSPWFGSTANDLNWKDRVKMQGAIQKYNCHSISMTCNLPNDVKEEEVAKIYETAWESGCKGVTVYRDGCRTGVLVTNTEEKKPDGVLVKKDAPKRPKSLQGEAWLTNVKGEQYYVVIGLLNGDPYEIFTGQNIKEDGTAVIPKSGISGSIIKHSRGKYSFDNETDSFNLTNGHNDENADALCRMISTSLRHGSDISFVVHQLEKTKGDLFTFSKAIGRTLKKYIKDGTAVHGEECPACGSAAIERNDGCVICKNCGNSKCG